MKRHYRYRLAPNSVQAKSLKTCSCTFVNVGTCLFISVTTLPNNFLKNKEKYKLLKNIPVEIIHGRYDMVCPPYAAYELHQLIPHSKLHFTIAGHTVTDEENKKKLIEITNKYV